MYFLEGSKQNLETIFLLSKPFIENDKEITHSSIKKGYFDFLQNHYPNVPFNQTEEIEFILKDRHKLERLSKLFALDDIPNSNVKADAQLEQLHTLLLDGYHQCQILDKNLFHIFNICVNSIFVNPSKVAGSQTTNAALGVLYINPSLDWTALDVLEAYIHELTHTLLFLDERRYVHYSNYEALNDPNNLAVTAVWNQQRPIHLVLHSIVVVAELLALRSKVVNQPTCKLHPATNKLIQSAKIAITSINDLSSYKNLTTARMHYIFEQVVDFISYY